MWHIILYLECLVCFFVFQIYDGLNHYSPKELKNLHIWYLWQITEDHCFRKSGCKQRDEVLEGCDSLTEEGTLLNCFQALYVMF